MIKIEAEINGAKFSGEAATGPQESMQSFAYNADQRKALQKAFETWCLTVREKVQHEIFPTKIKEEL